MNADQLKVKVQQYRYMDEDMFLKEIDTFNKTHDYCKKNKVKISEMQAKACFMLLDLDDSAELESEEVMEILGDRQLLGQNREQQLKNDTIEKVQKYAKSGYQFVRNLVGY